MDKEVRSIQVNTFQERLYCSCGAEMVFTGRELSCYPPFYVHQCSSCFEETSERVIYPLITYKPV